ncbi:MAG: DUF1254 domain-containing protein [Phycisphaerae bacterium]|nr:DUF1254 domain-containing protein [Phycisphaerae bacterium]
MHRPLTPHAAFITLGLVALCAPLSHARWTAHEKELIADADIYLLGRALVVRQEHIDLKEPGITYNVIKYNPLGAAEFVNPNLDVAYLEAWIAVDDQTPVLLEVPRIEGRYYTAQILDEWGEVITNINERNYPSQPFGKYAFVAPGSQVRLPEDAVRIELHSRKAKLLGRVELQNDSSGAVALQKQFKLIVQGNPRITPPARIPEIAATDLVGVEIFDVAEDLIVSASDVSPVAGVMQAKIRQVSRLIEDPDRRRAVDQLLKTEVIPEFLSYAVTRSGLYGNHWLGTLGTGNYGSDYKRRTSANLVGIWANTNDEVIYFVGTRDSEGNPLNGSHDYLIEFSPEARPERVVDGYWSLILVDVPDYRVVPNKLNRFNFNNYSPLTDEPDGSLRILLSKHPGRRFPKRTGCQLRTGRGSR